MAEFLQTGLGTALLIIAQSLLIVAFVMLSLLFLVYGDRKIWAAVQMRRGPNVVGPWGLLQSVADALKFVVKEIVVPAGVDRPVYFLAPMLSFVLAILAWACGLLAFLPSARHGAMRAHDGVLWPAARDAIAAAPVLGLAVLALPLIASLQFYAGYPLRVLTAEASRWLLAAWFTVQREGSSLLVDGQLVIVDAPCSGVQMAWAGYFTACAVALLRGLPGRAFMLRLPLVGLTVLAGNVLRNTALVALEATGRAASPAVHEGIGLLALAAVCGAIALLMKPGTTESGAACA